MLEVVRVHGGEVKEQSKGRSLLAWQRFLDFLRDGCLGHGGKDAARQYDGNTTHMSKHSHGFLDPVEGEKSTPFPF